MILIIFLQNKCKIGDLLAIFFFTFFAFFSSPKFSLFAIQYKCNAFAEKVENIPNLIFCTMHSNMEKITIFYTLILIRKVKIDDEVNRKFFYGFSTSFLKKLQYCKNKVLWPHGNIGIR